MKTKAPARKGPETYRRKFLIETLESRQLLSVTSESEPNHSRSSATELVATEDPPLAGLLSGLGTGNIDVADEDYWAITALAGDVVRVAVDTPSSILDANVEFLNSAGGVLRSDNNGGPGADSLVNNFEIATTGAYFVKVRGSSSTSIGTYQVRVDLARGIQLESDSGYSNDHGAGHFVGLAQSGNRFSGTIAGSIMSPEDTNLDEDRFNLGFRNAGNVIEWTFPRIGVEDENSPVN